MSSQFMGLLNYVRDILVVKISSTSTNNNKDRTRGYILALLWYFLYIISFNSNNNLRGDILINPVLLSQGYQLVAVEPEFNQVVWLQSQALNSYQNKYHQEDAKKIKCPLTQVL